MIVTLFALTEAKGGLLCAKTCQILAHRSISIFPPFVTNKT